MDRYYVFYTRDKTGYKPQRRRLCNFWKGKIVAHETKIIILENPLKRPKIFADNVEVECSKEQVKKNKTIVVKNYYMTRISISNKSKISAN